MILKRRSRGDGEIAVTILTVPLLPVLAEIVTMYAAAMRTAHIVARPPAGLDEEPECLLLAHEGNIVQRHITQFCRF